MVLENCCCCFNLEVGGVALGVFAFAFSSIWFSLNIYVMTIVYQTPSTMVPLGVSLTFAIMSVFAAGLLIYGIAERKKNYLIPWMIIAGVLLIPMAPFAIAAFIAFFPIGFPFYLWYCVYSLHQTLPRQIGHLSPRIESEILSPYNTMDK